MTRQQALTEASRVESSGVCTFCGELVPSDDWCCILYAENLRRMYEAAGLTLAEIDEWYTSRFPKAMNYRIPEVPVF